MSHRFTLTERQIRELIAATPPGYVASLTVAFTPADDEAKSNERTVNPADLIQP